MKYFFYSFLKLSSILPILLIIVLLACNERNDSSLTDIKVYPNDPFKKDIVSSQYFTIDTKQENLVEGNSGTVIYIPQNAFIDSEGNSVDAQVRIELAEALSPSDMILSNLTTTSDGKMLETDGMIYFNATTLEGQKLKVNPQHPVYIEIPTNKKKPGMMAYQGIRDEQGNMNWINPQPIKNYLIPVNIDLLDFLPEGFEAEVTKGLAIFKRKEATKEFVDSLYYSLSPNEYSIDTSNLSSIDMNEAFYNKHNQVKDGKYTKKSFDRNDIKSEHKDSEKRPVPEIDPAIIKVIHNKKFNNTLIATKEFEKRLQFIFKTCKNEILELYIRNLDKDMWVIDSMAGEKLAGEKLAGNKLQGRFQEFSKEKLTNVKDAEKNYGGLIHYYEKQLEKVKKELASEKKKLFDEIQKQNKKAEKVANEYREVLWKREKYRMEKYGFQWSNTGWVNVDKPMIVSNDQINMVTIIQRPYGESRLDLIIGNFRNFERAYCYVLYSSLKSIYRLNSDGDSLFYVGNKEDKMMLMPKNKKAMVVAVGYKEDKVYVDIKEIETFKNTNIQLTLRESSKDEFKKLMNGYNKNDFEKENRIEEDLKFMEFFYQEKKRQEELKQKVKFEKRLERKAFPCCLQGPDENIESLFEHECKYCHSATDEKKVGPSLFKIRERRPIDWLIRFTKNSDKEKASGDPYTTKLTAEYGGMTMPEFEHLSDCEIEKIFEYIDNLNKEEEGMLR